MTFIDFLPCIKDILGPYIGPDNLNTLTTGTVVFAVTVARGGKPKTARAIVNASYFMAINAHSAPEVIDFVGLTDRNHTTLRNIRPDNLEPNGTIILYHANPLPANDPRNGKHWTSWPKAIQSNQKSN